jgi:hypothetical protein
MAVCTIPQLTLSRSCIMSRALRAKLLHVRLCNCLVLSDCLALKLGRHDQADSIVWSLDPADQPASLSLKSNHQPTKHQCTGPSIHPEYNNQGFLLPHQNFSATTTPRLTQFLQSVRPPSADFSRPTTISHAKTVILGNCAYPSFSRASHRTCKGKFAAG